MVATAIDVIGDIHGHAEALERLLVDMGYREGRGAYRHPERQVIFVGDLIDRGPGQLRTLEVARAMVEAGSARVVMGNHEFNAVAWATRTADGEWSRPHTDKNRRQHQAFLEAVGEDSARHREWVAWFRTIPMWIDIGGLRIVHACWHPASMAVLGEPTLSDEMVMASKGSELYEAIEVVLKGPEIDLGERGFADKDGFCRHRARYRWWDPDATTLAAAAEIPEGSTTCDGEPYPPLPDTALDLDSLPTAPTEVPVLFGHYWRRGPRPRTAGPLVACLDWSVAGGGPLVAYRWSGETELADDNLVAVG